MINTNITKLLFIIIVTIFASSCTNLDEEVFSELVPENFYQNEDEVIAALAPAYADLRSHVEQRGSSDLEEHTSDIMVGVTRDYGGWFDGGHYQRHHEHTWNAQTGYLNNIWNNGYKFVNRANMLIYQFENIENFDPELQAKFIGELRVLRAFGYYILLNSFGNVPLVDRFDVEEGYIPTNNSNFNAGRIEIFNFIEKELLDVIPLLDDKVDKSTYGRFNKWAAIMILTKLYMNAEVWTGTPRWQDAISYADQIIESGHYQLETDYFANFARHNENSKENIFVIPFHPTLTSSTMTVFAYMVHHHFSSASVFGVSLGGWNGPCAIPSFIHTFDEDDLRLKGWAIGPQYIKGTNEIILSSRPPNNPLIYTVDFVNIFDENDKVERNYTNALENNGARFQKYEISFDPSSWMENDWVVYRFADVLLMKAEALMRNNGGIANNESVNLVNQVRSRAFKNTENKLYTTNSLTLDELLKERGRELYYEGMRRNDLIRFGKFAKGSWEWYDRSNHGEEKNWFPIPQEQINANNKLIQNPGY